MSLKHLQTSRCSQAAIFAGMTLYCGLWAGDEGLVMRGDNGKHQTPL